MARMRPFELSESCVYTIATPERLHRAADTGHKLTEHRRWKQTAQDVASAEANGVSVAILFASARDCTRLVAWSKLLSVALGKSHTEYTIGPLLRLPSKTPQDLRMLSSGRHVASGFIRPYVPCHTPAFIMKEARAPRPWAPPKSVLRAIKDGELILTAHERYDRKRNQAVVRDAKRRGFDRDGVHVCQVCDLDFSEIYGGVGDGYIEAHHIRPLSEYPDGGRDTTVDDFAMVCANCHRMLHRAPELGVAKLRELVRRRKRARDKRLTTSAV